MVLAKSQEGLSIFRIYYLAVDKIVQYTRCPILNSSVRILKKLLNKREYPLVGDYSQQLNCRSSALNVGVFSVDAIALFHSSRWPQQKEYAPREFITSSLVDVVGDGIADSLLPKQFDDCLTRELAIA